MHFSRVIRTFTSKKGNKIVIRYPKPDDLDNMVTFVNGLVEEDTFLMLNKKITKKEESKYLNDSLNKIKIGKKIQIVALVNGKFAGNCEIRRRDKRQTHVGEIGVAVAAPYREEGIGSELLKTLIEEGKKLGLRLLVLGCFANNPRAIHVYEKLGFKRAGQIPGIYHYQGDYIGEELFYMHLV